MLSHRGNRLESCRTTHTAVVVMLALTWGCGSDESTTSEAAVPDSGGFVFTPSDATDSDASTGLQDSAAQNDTDGTDSGAKTDVEGRTRDDVQTVEDSSSSGPIACNDGTACPPNSTCSDASGFCECNPGFEPQFEGLQCTDIDECTDGSAECHTNSTCKNLFGSYTCNCDDGYYNAGIGVCADFDECEINGSCPKGAGCINLDGSFECECPDGLALSEDQESCEDIDECSSAPCAADEQCVNKVGSYDCVPEGTCVPQCTGLQCGPDGCGGSCGACGGGTSCSGGLCVPDVPISGSCGDAPTLSVPGSVAGTTTGQLSDFDVGFDSCTGFTSKGADVAYALAGAPGQTVTITLAPEFDASLYVVTDCDAVADSCLAGADAAVNAGTESITVTLPTSGTAFAIVDSFYSDSKGFGAFVLTVAPPCTPQCAGKSCGSDGCGGICGTCASNEECASGQCTADPGGSGETGDTCGTATSHFAPFTVSGTTDGAAPDYSLDFGDCTGFFTPGADVVYSFFALASETYTVTLEPEFEAAVYVLTDCSAPATSCVAGADEETGATPETITFSPTVTGTHYIVVDSFSSISGGSFTLSVTESGTCVPDCTGKSCGDDGCGGSCGTCPGGTCLGGTCTGGPTGGQWNTCETANFEVVPFTVIGSTVGNTNTYDPGAGGCTIYSEDGPDTVFETFVTSGTTYEITLSPDVEGGVYVVTDCEDVSGTCLGGSDDGFNTTPETVEFTAAASGFVYVIVDAWQPNISGTFTLSMNAL